jgi:hypothetical protein
VRAAVAAANGTERARWQTEARTAVITRDIWGIYRPRARALGCRRRLRRDVASTCNYGQKCRIDIIETLSH